MVKRMVLHGVIKKDRENKEVLIAGRRSAPNIMVVESGPDFGKISVLGVFTWIASYARSQGGLDELIILAHGAYGYENPNTQTCGPKFANPGAIVLGSDYLFVGNVSVTKVVNGLIKTIYLVVCGIGGSESPEKNSQQWSPDRFCTELSQITGAEVIASPTIQEITTSKNWFTGNNEVDFDSVMQMEPPVWSYKPDGSEPKKGIIKR